MRCAQSTHRRTARAEACKGRTCELMRAQASWRSLVTMPSRAIAFSIATSASVATWQGVGGRGRGHGVVAGWAWFRKRSNQIVASRKQRSPRVAAALVLPAPRLEGWCNPACSPARPTWCPRPRLPLWIMMQTWPTWSMPILRAATRSNTSSTTWGGRVGG